MEWRVIKGFEDYAVSDTGLVMRMGHVKYTAFGGAYYVEDCVLKGLKDRKGYLMVCPFKNGKKYTLKVHRLVAEAFVDNPEQKPQVNHKDGNKQNNCVENLEWCTAKENVSHAMIHGLMDYNGVNSTFSKLTEEQVRDIRKNCVKGKRGYTFLDFANKYGVSKECIRDVYNRRTYKNII